MSKITIYAIICGLFFIIGVASVVEGFPYLTNSISVQDNISSIRSFLFEKIPVWIYLKMETKNAFTANNPIDVEMITIPINLEEIKSIQVNFIGAEKYFPDDDLGRFPEMPEFVSPNEFGDEYYVAIEKYTDQRKQMYEGTYNQASAHVLHLYSDKDYDTDFNFSGGIERPENFPKYSSLSGSLHNLRYNLGGTFDIGITITKRDGEVIGYEMSNISYILQDAIEVSPPEALIQIKNNNIMTGLGWIGIGLPFLIVALTGWLEILKHFAFL